MPGPLLFTQHPEVIYGLFGGLFTANLAMIPLGILIMTPCLWLVTQPKPLLSAGIYALIFTGIFSINNDSFDIGLALVAAILGYGLKYFKFPFLPLVLGTILGYMLESSFRRALLMSDNDYIDLCDRSDRRQHDRRWPALFVAELGRPFVVGQPAASVQRRSPEIEMALRSSNRVGPAVLAGSRRSQRVDLARRWRLSRHRLAAIEAGAADASEPNSVSLQGTAS